MKQKLFTVYVFTKVNTRRFFRDKTAIFFTVLFPLIFLFVFGGIFGKGGATSFNVALINQSSSQFAQTYVNEAKINKQFVNAAEPFTVTTTQSNDETLTRFDYTFAGLLGFSIIGMGIFGPVNVFPELKKAGVLRRFHTTTLRVWQYFLSTMSSQA